MKASAKDVAVTFKTDVAGLIRQLVNLSINYPGVSRICGVCYGEYIVCSVGRKISMGITGVEK